MSILDQLDYRLPPPFRLYHFAEQPITTRWRIEAWDSHNRKYAPTLEEIEAIRAEIERKKNREAAQAERLARLRASR